MSESSGVVLAPFAFQAYCEACQEGFSSPLSWEDDLPVLTCPQCDTTYPLREVKHKGAPAVSIAAQGVSAHATRYRWVCVECGTLNTALSVRQTVRCAACYTVLPVEAVRLLSPDEIERLRLRVQGSLHRKKEQV